MITKRLTLLLFIGMAWGQSLKLVNTDGQSVIINPSGYDLKGDLLYLNGTKFFLNDVFNSLDITVYAPKKIKFGCSCRKDKLLATLKGHSKKELESMQ